MNVVGVQRQRRAHGRLPAPHPHALSVGAHGAVLRTRTARARATRPSRCPGPTEARLCALARETGLWLMPGSMFEKVDAAQGALVYNTTSVINPQGEVIRRFRKLFPFRPYETRRRRRHASSASSTLPDVGRFGVSICYDMWFPETTRTLVAMGAEVILHPTMTDTIDRDVELSIARASAVHEPGLFLRHQRRRRRRRRPLDHHATRPATCCTRPRPAPRSCRSRSTSASVRRERERGLRSNLGQPLKSFRDRDVDFDVYRRDSDIDRLPAHTGAAEQTRLSATPRRACAADAPTHRTGDTGMNKTDKAD